MTGSSRRVPAAAPAPRATPRGVLVAAGLLLALVAGAYLAFGLATASTTFACDFEAYAGAARRWLAGEAIYDLSLASTGECGIYQYPPPFVLAALPFALLPAPAGAGAWIAALVVAYLVGVALLPLPVGVRVAIGFLGAVSWPFIFGVRIGQVGPILLLLFALGWRWLDRPLGLGVTTGLGALVKLQPAVVLGWLAARLELRALGAGLATMLLVAGTAALVGLGDWLGMATLLRQLSNAAEVPANVSFGATAYRAGLPASTASLLQVGASVTILGLVVLGARLATREAGFLAAVIASQAVSPIMWDHYALVLLLPVGWLVTRRQWWALAIPISQAWVLIVAMPLVIYPAAYVVLLAAVLVTGVRERRTAAPSTPGEAAWTPA